jgi:hypothetical protein
MFVDHYLEVARGEGDSRSLAYSDHCVAAVGHVEGGTLMKSRFEMDGPLTHDDVELCSWRS